MNWGENKDNQTKDLATLEAENEITAEYKCAKDAFSDEVDKAGKSFKIYKIKSILKGAGICAFFMISSNRCQAFSSSYFR
ncbi:MAG: hypothetical protein ACOXZS_03770 [Bacilli bacterium]